jgi:ubiquinone/menaquinone biosynthesis C-methylase UbiE
MQAYWGATKHFGGYKTTQELAKMCHIGPGKRVLEVGCGVGVTAWRLAKEYECFLVGVDLSEDMVAWSRRRAKREKVTDMTDFRVADAQHLPFEDDQFDAVITESVTAFPEDKRKAVSEYVRVTKPGGYVGLNEGTWLKSPQPPELVQYIQQTMENAKFLTADVWEELLLEAGLKDMRADIFELTLLGQWRNQMGGLTSSDKKDTLRAFKGFFSLMIKDPKFRKYARGISPSMGILRSLFKYLGYGLYVGRKA